MILYDTLRQLVLSGALDDVERIPEARLAEQCGVSRTPIREALQRLESEGLVHAQGRGIRLRVLGVEELLDVLDARAGLEGWAVYRAAQRVAAGEVAPARLAELDALAEDAHAHTESGDVARAAEANRAFHEAVAALAESPATSAALRRWWDQITISTRRTIQTSTRVREVHDEHGSLLRALRAGDPAAARAAAEDHALATRDALARLHPEGTTA